MSQPKNIISLNITRFPQNLLIPDIENRISIQATNHSNKSEYFKFIFEGENLKISSTIDGIQDKIEFNPGETKNIDMNLEPVIDGFGKVIINANWLEISEYSVQVQKIRESVQTSRTGDILEKYSLTGKESVDPINPKDFFIEMSEAELKKAEYNLEVMKDNYKSLGTAKSDDYPDITIEKIESNIKTLAKGFLSNKQPLRALELALTLSDKHERQNFYFILARAYGFKDTNVLLQIIKSLKDSKLQQKLYKCLTLDQASLNAVHALKAANFIKDTNTRNNLLNNIFGNVSQTDPQLALKLMEQVDDHILKFTSLFIIVRSFLESDEKSESINVIMQAINEIQEFIKENLKNKKSQKYGHELLQDAVFVLAEISNPKAADSVISSISIQELKEDITKDLFDDIYMIVEEIRTKTETHLVFSQYFLLNTHVSRITNDIKHFCAIGGNLSSNILRNDFDFKVAFLSLFSFSFSIFPIIDRVYNDLKHNENKSFAYYIFPSIANYDENENKILKNTLSQFFSSLINGLNQVMVFNLDFIPYLGKPTIILSSESETNDLLCSRIKNIGDAINLIVDDSVFQGGRIHEELQAIFPSQAVKIINLVLSYEFINDYDLFKTFVQTLL